jgi:hypothetical protein
MVLATGFKNYGVEITFIGVTSLLNFLKIYHWLINYSWGITDG